MYILTDNPTPKAVQTPSIAINTLYRKVNESDKMKLTIRVNEYALEETIPVPTRLLRPQILYGCDSPFMLPCGPGHGPR